MEEAIRISKFISQQLKFISLQWQILFPISVCQIFNKGLMKDNIRLRGNICKNIKLFLYKVKIEEQKQRVVFFLDKINNVRLTIINKLI